MDDYWKASPPEAAHALGVSLEGLSSADAEARLAAYGPNIIQRQRPLTRLRLLWRQLRSPLLLLLIFAAAASLAGGEWVDAASVIAIVVASVGIGFVREYPRIRHCRPSRPGFTLT